MEKLLELKKVSYRYPSAKQDDYTVKDIDLKIHAGDVIKITGRNGSGKTTLLKVIGGLFEPSLGSIDKNPDLSAVYLDQNTSNFLGTSLTIYEQLRMCYQSDQILPKVASGKKRDRFKAFLETYNIGLENKLDHFIADLSGGQKQIIALASVLLNKSNLLILDEFNAAMDSKSTELSLKFLNDALKKSDVAIIYVSHHIEELLSPNKFLEL